MKAWLAIERLLDEETSKALRPPAAPAHVAKAVATLGSLPAPLRELLARHDGMKDSPLFLNVRLLPIAEVVKTWRMRMASAQRDGYVWSREWLPITDADGDHICVDRKSGRVISFQNAGGRARVVAPSLVAWLARVPRFIRAERKDAEREAARIPPPPAGATRKERGKQAKIDAELGHFAGFVAHLERGWGKGAVPEERVLGYRPVARGVRSTDVVARSLELGHVEKTKRGYAATEKGRR